MILQFFLDGPFARKPQSNKRFPLSTVTSKAPSHNIRYGNSIGKSLETDHYSHLIYEFSITESQVRSSVLRD